MYCCSVLHFTTWGGQTGRGQGAGGGHLVGAGHLTSGQRGLGQGGHSPPSLRQAELSTMIGWGLGILDFKTYRLKSGVGGHSDFNMYCDISGIAGQGGTLAFKTYLLKSGSRQGGQGGQTGREGPEGPAQPPHGQLPPQRPQRGPGIPPPNSNPKNPSLSFITTGADCLPTKYPTAMAAKNKTTM